MTYGVYILPAGYTFITKLAGTFDSMEAAIAYIDEHGLSIYEEGVCLCDPNLYHFDCK